MRTIRTTVEFGEAFRLSGFDERQPAGSYRVDVDEEAIDGLTFLAHRRVGAILYVPAGTHALDCRYAVPMTLAELDAATAPNRAPPRPPVT